MTILELEAQILKLDAEVGNLQARVGTIDYGKERDRYTRRMNAANQERRALKFELKKANIERNLLMASTSKATPDVLAMPTANQLLALSLAWMRRVAMEFEVDADDQALIDRVRSWLDANWEVSQSSDAQKVEK
jgi:hypothetical protein